MTWLLVTPARNEARRLPMLAASLAAQTFPTVGLWVIVDDGSTDGTADCIDASVVPFPVLVEPVAPSAGIKEGGAFAAFLRGADVGLRRVPDARRVMKLDADVVLDPGYFAAMHRMLEREGDVGLAGGVLTGWREREQRHHVRGALKCYSRPAFALVAELPAALGFDTVDEVAIRAAGLGVTRVDAARARATRRTGSSVGDLAGRARGGTVARWSGYHPVYFLCRLVRYAGRRPLGAGAVAMLWGYLTAGTGPFPRPLRRQVRSEQAARLAALARRPLRTVRNLYGVDA